MIEALDTLTKAFITACGAGLLTLIIFIIKYFVQMMKRDKMTLDALSHDAYYKDCWALLKKDELTKDELENHGYLYKTYRARGLNGTGDKLHQLIMEKPVKVDR